LRRDGFVSFEEIGVRAVGALGERGAAELLSVLERSDEERAALIGRLLAREGARWLGDLLVDLEIDEVSRLQLAEGIRVALSSS
jgi:hypothetical protein